MTKLFSEKALIAGTDGDDVLPFNFDFRGALFVDGGPGADLYVPYFTPGAHGTVLINLGAGDSLDALGFPDPTSITYTERMIHVVDRELDIDVRLVTIGDPWIF